jgi:hypothetical protein
MLLQRAGFLKNIIRNGSATPDPCPKLELLSILKKIVSHVLNADPHKWIRNQLTSAKLYNFTMKRTLTPI